VQLVVVAVKAYDTAPAMRQHAAVVGPTTVVTTFQNGLGNVETIAGLVGETRVLGGTTALGANLLAPGRGELRGDVLGAAGIAAVAVPNIGPRIWSKLAVNTGINALTAILRVRNGVLALHPETLALLESAVRETVAVARARGVDLDAESLVERTREVARRTAANVSSMLADVRARRRTEIAEINGAVAVAGRALGIPTPINELLAVLVCAVEATSAERVPEPPPSAEG
jgi:2-dehydropantoate 2-reductase